MPPSSEPCDIPNCDGTAATTISPRDTRRQVRPRDRTDTFREGPVISIASNSSDNEVSPAFEHSYSFSAAGGWLYTEWSEVFIILGSFPLLSFLNSKKDHRPDYIRQKLNT